MHPVGKSMRWIKKWMAPFLMVSTSFITVQSLGKIAQAQCTPAAGAKMWCLFLFCFFLSRSESQHRAFEGCIVRTSIALPFVARFRRSFQPFFTMCKIYAGCALRRSCVFSSRLFSNFYLFSYSLLKYFILYELPYCDTATTWHLHHSPLELKNFASHFYCTVWIYD